MADADYTILTPIDKETLRDVLAFGSVDKVAKLKHVSSQTIRTRVTTAIDTLIRQIDVWQNPHHKFVELTQRMMNQERELAEEKNLTTHLIEKCKKLEREKYEMQEHISQLEVILPPNAPKITASLKMVDKKTKRMLDRSLEDINIPTNIISKLRANNVKKVYDLIILSEGQLYKLDGIRLNDVSRIHRCLDAANLHLETNVRWIPDVQEYYTRNNQSFSI